MLNLPITEMEKKQLAQKRRLFYKICRDCGVKNSAAASRCRKCRGSDLRWKKRELGAK
ncbi:50S ribosomal protein L40e [Thermoproteota archaeon]